jgi:hypothetical protein
MVLIDRAEETLSLHATVKYVIDEPGFAIS